MDGEEWKQDAQHAEWNSPANIWLSEYSSFMDVSFDTLLRPVVQHGKTLDKIAVKMVREEIDVKLANPQFKSIPSPIQNAYTTFREYLIGLENSTNPEVGASNAVLEGLFRLAINCKTYGDSLKGGEKSHYFGRDPCRDDKIRTRVALAHAEREGLSGILESARKMAEVCNNCPYRAV